MCHVLRLCSPFSPKKQVNRTSRKKHTIEFMLSRVRTFNLSGFQCMQLRAGWKPRWRPKESVKCIARKREWNALELECSYWKKRAIFQLLALGFWPKVDSIKKATNGMTNCEHTHHPPPPPFNWKCICRSFASTWAICGFRAAYFQAPFNSKSNKYSRLRLQQAISAQVSNSRLCGCVGLPVCWCVYRQQSPCSSQRTHCQS